MQPGLRPFARRWHSGLWSRSIRNSRRLPLVQLARVDLNTAGLEALTILPGVGEKRAQAILDYRLRNGAFHQVADAAKVPGLTAEIVASWGELATVS